MEPVATLSLVCNVMQVISFTGEVFRLVRSLQDDGSPDPRLESTTNSLDQLISTLSMRLDNYNSTQLPSYMSPRQQEEDKNRLRTLTSNLLQNVGELHRIVGKLSTAASQSTANTAGASNQIPRTSSGIVSKRSTFLVVLKYKLHYQSKITSLERNINKAHTILNTEFLTRICDSQAAEKARSEAAFLTLQYDRVKSAS
ncbi:hypothetical protein F4808DRAFT_425785 [Astrocystis sublimbata]|nr:hypothetical protein F4808DRAFT_425785 [Astrocystis sublimbata]